MSEKRHTIGGTDGWLNVKRKLSSNVIALPEFLQVEVTHSKDGRDFFNALEGSEIGKRSL